MAEEAQSLGQALQAGREAQGLSREEVAKALRLSTSSVRRLENEDWEKMPAPVFVRGYISSYARLVGLDAEALLSLYRVVDVRSPTGPRIELASVEGDHKGRRAPWIFVGAALVAAVLVAVSLLLVLPEAEEPGVERDAADADAVAQAAAQQEAAAPAVADAVAEAEAAAQQEVEVPAAPAIEEVSPEEAAEQVPEAAANPEAPPSDALPSEALPSEAESEAQPEALPEQAATVPEPSAPAPEAADFASRFGADASALGALSASPVEEEDGVFRVTPAGDDEIEFLFSETCWVEVKDLDGRYLHAVLGEPNERLVLVGEGPFDVKLGYVPGVVLRFNGAPVPLAAHTRDQVANLVLGR